MFVVVLLFSFFSHSPVFHIDSGEEIRFTSTAGLRLLKPMINISRIKLVVFVCMRFLVV